MSHPQRAVPPFRHLQPVVAAAACYLLAAAAWAVLGPVLPGGRWFAVHLFTVGVVTNLILALTHHFTITLLHSGAPNHRTTRFALLNAGAVALLGGRLLHSQGLVGVGGSALIVTVAWLYRDLRGQRQTSLTGRFAFVVRGYERACGAFLHGALLGVLMGIGVLGGTWYSAARLAHLHLNVLGWGGLTLLSTLVFFGPTMMRVRLQPGADSAARTALRAGATGLSGGALALLATGWGGGPQMLFRGLAALGLAVYAAAAVAVCLPVLRAGARAIPSAQAWMIRGSCAWFAIGVWADVLAVATNQLWLLDAVGIALLTGVLGQAILAALNYLGPMVLAAGSDARSAARAILDRQPRTRAAALNLGVFSLVASIPLGRILDGGATFGQGLTLLQALGWAGILTAVVAQVGFLAQVRLHFAQAAGGHGGGRGGDGAPPV